MSGKRILGDITNLSIVSRREDLAVAVEALIDGSVHVDGELVKRGTLLGKILAGTVGAVGKFRAYAEAVVQTTAFSTASVNFQVDPTGAIAMHFRVGDVIESTGGLALGTIATYNSATGVGTLTANSSNNLAAGQSIRVAAANLGLSSQNGRVLQEEVLMSGNDEPMDAYTEGFFIQSRTTITAAAIASMSAMSPTSGEVRLK